MEKLKCPEHPDFLPDQGLFLWTEMVELELFLFNTYVSYALSMVSYGSSQPGPKRNWESFFGLMPSSRAKLKTCISRKFFIVDISIGPRTTF